MPNISLDRMTEKQRAAWIMRYHYGWVMTKIAMEMGTKESAVSRLIQRAHRSAGLSLVPHFTVKRTKPRAIRVMSLSDVWNV